MRFTPTLLALGLQVALSVSHVRVHARTCTVTPIGGGQDDGPNIICAFDACKSGGTVVLDKHYVVNTVLIITGLQDVNIQLSGVGASRYPPILHSIDVSPVQYTPNISYWSPNSYYMGYQNVYEPSVILCLGPHMS